MYSSLAETDLLTLLHDGDVSSRRLPGKDEITGLGHGAFRPRAIRLFADSIRVRQFQASSSDVGSTDQRKSLELRRSRSVKAIDNELAGFVESLGHRLLH